MTLDDLRAQLQAKVDAGEITIAEMEADLALFQDMTAGQTAPSLLDVDALSSSREPVPQPSVFDRVTNPTEEVYAGEIGAADMGQLQRLATHGATPELMQQAQAELAERERIEGLTFIESLTDPAALERAGRRALTSPAQTAVGLSQGLPALGMMGVAQLMDGEDGENTEFTASLRNSADNLLDDLTINNEQINQNFGVSASLNPLESLAESAIGGLIPGSIVVKAAGMAGDFAMDQAVRELTDSENSPYRTIFDRTNTDDMFPTLGTLTAIGATSIAFIATSAVSQAGVKALAKRRMPLAPTTRNVDDALVNSNTGVQSIETPGDVIKAQQIDEQSALADLARRAGMSDEESVVRAIDLDTHASASTRIREGLQVGTLTHGGTTFAPRVAPATLIEAHRRLPLVTREKVSAYINTLDALDDAYIAQSRGEDVGDLIVTLQTQAAGLRQSTPEAVRFSNDYNSITRAMRDFLEGDMFDSSTRANLDMARPNYVPVDLSPSDPSAPFMQQLSQTLQAPPLENRRVDWFLENRTSNGAQDQLQRRDPFTVLINYTEAAMTAKMRNATQLKYIDNLLTSEHGQGTIRKLTDEDNIAELGERVVTVRRNGDVERYVTSKLQAQLLRFDPYVSQYAWLQVPKRVAEQAAVGPMTGTFAAVTAIRDHFAGQVMGAPAVRTYTAGDTLAAIPKQLWARAQRELQQSIERNLLSGEKGVLGLLQTPAQQQLTAQRIGNSYSNTLYHLANEKGGFDASVLRSRIVAAKDTFALVGDTLQSSKLLNNAVTESAIARVGTNLGKTLAQGWVSLFDAVQNAPRYAALEQGVKAGLSVEDAVRQARLITGDTTRSGRPYTPQGTRVTGDIGGGTRDVGTHGTAFAGAVVQESTPFVNPMIQGLRTLGNSFVEDPAGFYGRAFTGVAMPTIAAYGWNEMLGTEYNEYAIDRRSARDAAMELYIGVPGEPPENGVTLPLPHELLPFSAPLTTALHSMNRGDTSMQTRRAMQELSSTILANSVELGTPTTVGVTFNLLGVSAPSTMLGDDTYMIREDNVGVLPENIEKAIRTQFTSVGAAALQAAEQFQLDPGNLLEKALAGGAAFGEARLQAAPVIPGPLGVQNASVSFSERDQRMWRQADAITTAVEAYRMWHDPEYLSAAGNDLTRSRNMTKLQSFVNEVPEVGKGYFGPNPGNEPTNPLIPLVTEELTARARNNEDGFRGLSDRYTALRKMVTRLKDYGPGNAIVLAQWADEMQSQEHEDPDDQFVVDVLSEISEPLTTLRGRTQLINALERRRSEYAQQMTSHLDTVERSITNQLREAGQIAPDQSFSIEKHLRPFDSDPLGSAPN